MQLKKRITITIIIIIIIYPHSIFYIVSENNEKKHETIFVVNLYVI